MSVPAKTTDDLAPASPLLPSEGAEQNAMPLSSDLDKICEDVITRYPEVLAHLGE